MSGYWYDDDEDYYDDYDELEELEPEEDALMFKGSIEAKSKRGPIGETWWGVQWVRAMQRLGGARLDRGKSYARNGRVKDLVVQRGAAFANVKGSRRKPYYSQFAIKTFTEKQWGRALDALAEQAIFAAKLLAGEMPGDIEDIFQSVGLSLFPRSYEDISFGCSCPDWGDPCKHSAAIYYLVAELLDRDPFTLFHLRGYTRAQALEGLRQRRGGAPAPAEETAQAKDEKPTTAPLPAGDFDTFWGEADAQLSVPAPVAPLKSPVMAYMADLPDDVQEDLEAIYEHISETALLWLSDGEAGEGDEELPPLEEALSYFGSRWGLSMDEVPLLDDRNRRFERILVDTYGTYEQLWAFYTYLEDALNPPFEALWRDADEPGHEEPVTVLGIVEADDRRGVLLQVMRGKRKRRAQAEQVWALDRDSVNATVLDDYRYWVERNFPFDD